MNVADHLNVRAREYDERIRTFVPHYETMVETAAATLRHLEASAPTIVDLGTGTGALADRCLAVRPSGRLVGIDADREMLRVAEARLSDHDRVELVEGDFLDTPLPPCDAVTACLALHHVATEEEKRGLFRAFRQALRPGGLVVSGDRFTASDPALREAERHGWLAHLRETYTPAESREHLAAWAEEDFYFPLEDELAWMDEAGLSAEVVWRAEGFAVVAARRRA